MNPLLARSFERRRLCETQQTGVAVDQGIHIRIDRVHGRHDENARPGTSHLVRVQPHLRQPVPVKDSADELGLLLREHVRVPVVVMTDILVVEPGHRSIFVRRAEGLVVPVGHHDLAVGIQAGHQQENHVVQNGCDLRGILRGQPVHGLERHLGGADLAGMNAAGDEHEDARFLDQGFEPPRPRQSSWDRTAGG